MSTFFVNLPSGDPDCLACGAPAGSPPAGPCWNHGTPQAILIEAGPTADGGWWIQAKGNLLKEVWVD